MTLESALAEFVVQTQYEDFPRHIVEMAKKDVSDTIGVAIAGSRAPGIQEVVELLTDFERGGTCNVLIYGQKVPPHTAALVNAAMAHALDFDDDYEPGTQHVGVTLVPAALAASQHLGGVSGRDFLTAVILGIEVTCRMTAASKVLTKPSLGWMFTPLYGSFAAAAAVGKLLGLDREAMLNAWGLAYAQASGNVECVRTGALSKRLQVGFATSAGLLSAFMASRGLTGAKQSMTGQYGIFNVYQRGDWDGSPLTADLGQAFALENLSFKPYPCGRPLHAPIDAALEIVQEHRIEPDDIEEVIVDLTPRSYSLNCVPREVKYNPPTIVDAQFSIPYVVATALAKRRLTIDDFTDDAIRDKDVHRILGVMRCETNLEIIQPTAQIPAPTRPAKVTVRTGNQTYSAQVDYARGHPQNPMSEEELDLKFRDCVGRAAKPLAPGAVQSLIADLGSLEELDNVNELVSLLV